MKTYQISVPVAGYLVYEVHADSQDEALEAYRDEQSRFVSTRRLDHDAIIEEKR